MAPILDQYLCATWFRIRVTVTTRMGGGEGAAPYSAYEVVLHGIYTLAILRHQITVQGSHHQG